MGTVDVSSCLTKAPVCFVTIFAFLQPSDMVWEQEGEVEGILRESGGNIKGREMNYGPPQ